MDFGNRAKKKKNLHKFSNRLQSVAVNCVLLNISILLQIGYYERAKQLKFICKIEHNALVLAVVLLLSYRTCLIIWLSNSLFIFSI